MKRYLFPIFLSLFVGVFLGRFVLEQYGDFDVFPVNMVYGNVYFLEQGIYDSIDDMKNGMSSFDYYIYDIENDKYHTYLGITGNYENALKVKEFYKEKGYDIYVRENNIKNERFISVLSQYDILLSDSNIDNFDSICNQILSSYEEVVINEDKGDSEE